MAACFDLYRTTRDNTAWLGSFLKLEVAIEALKSAATEEPGLYYVTDDQGRRLYLLDNRRHSKSE